MIRSIILLLITCNDPPSTIQYCLLLAFWTRLPKKTLIPVLFLQKHAINCEILIGSWPAITALKRFVSRRVYLYIYINTSPYSFLYLGDVERCITLIRIFPFMINDDLFRLKKKKSVVFFCRPLQLYDFFFFHFIAYKLSSRFIELYKEFE
jgi:hypothetical protein